MRHNTLKRTLAAGLAVLCFAAYAPTFVNTDLFDIAITVSAEGEEKTWTYNITEGGVYTCPATLNSNVVISGGTEDNPVVIKIDGDVTSTVTNNYVFHIKNGYVKIIGNNNASISCKGFISIKSSGSYNATGDANITVSNIVVQSSTLNIVAITSNYKCTTEFENVTIKDYKGTGSGAVVIDNYSWNTTHTFKNCTFENSRAYVTGGLSAWGNCEVIMEDCTFKDCIADNATDSSRNGGGAIWVRDNAKLTLDNCTIENCTGKFGAVGVQKSNATLNLKGNTTIIDNSTGNIYLTTDARFNVDEDFTGKAGVTTQTAPTDAESVTLSTGLGETQAALANKNIISDNADYNVKYDNGDLLLVKPVPVTGITLDETRTLNVGDTGTLTAAITPENATDQTLTWTSSDPSVATVDANGTITAVGAGKATITATATNGTEDTYDDVSATCTVTVNALSWISNDCTVTLDNGTLTVSKTAGAATGAMADYMQYDAPWKDYSSYIKSVIVEDGVTHIGDQSFNECENLETITVNSNLTSTGYQFAYSCNNLKTVTFNGNVVDFDDISSCEKLESVTFNGNVGTIKPCGFDSNSSLKNVTFNGSVEHFDYYAFVYCPSLETVTLTPQASGTLYIDEEVTDNTTAKIKYANTSGYLYDGETRIEDGALVGDLQGKTLTWGPVYKDGIGAQLVGYSLSLDGDIGVNFYMELADDVAASETAYMQFTIPAGSETKTETVPVKKAGSGTANGKTYHVFKCNVSAKDMASQITAQIIDGDNKGTKYTYSVKDYADYLLEHNEVEEYANAATLVKKLLNYGAASQTYFGIAGTAVNAGLSEAERVIDNVKIPEKFKYNEANTHLPTGVTLTGVTLSLKSETTLSLYFTGLPDNTVFTCEGKDNVESVKNGSYMVARIRGIKAEELENDFTVTFGNDGSVKYNAMTYCYNVLNGGTTNDALKNVCRALYQYAEAAKPNS